MNRAEAMRRCRVEPGSKFRVAAHDSDWSDDGALSELGGDELKDRAKLSVQRALVELSEAQGKLYAGDSHSVLIVLQAMDAAGKDGMIQHVMSGLNPQGCQVFSFKQPSAEELDHDFLWRYVRCLPERGRIGIFNRSYYEETLVVRVHPEVLERQKLPPGKRGGKFWKQRFDSINAFERHLTRNGTLILKFFLNVSKAEQKRRFLERLTVPEKYWKFSAADLRERAFWDDYMHAYEETLSATSTDWAPWYAIPADHKWVARAIVSGIIAESIEGLDLRRPRITPEQRRELDVAREQLEAE